MPFLSSEDLLDSGIKPGSPALQADSLPSAPPEKPYIYGVLSINETHPQFAQTREILGFGLSPRTYS